MDDQSATDDMSTGQQQIKAPTYVELVGTVEDLRVRLRNAELAAEKAKNVSTVMDTESTKYNEVRMFANLENTVKTFSGAESNYDAADWIQTVGNMADLNSWPFGYRIQFVRSNFTEAARDWFMYRKFSDWDDFCKQFRATFVR